MTPGMIAGIGALDFRTLGTSLGAADNAFQGNVGSAGVDLPGGRIIG